MQVFVVFNKIYKSSNYFSDRLIIIVNFIDVNYKFSFYSKILCTIDISK